MQHFSLNLVTLFKYFYCFACIKTCLANDRCLALSLNLKFSWYPKASSIILSQLNVFTYNLQNILFLIQISKRWDDFRQIIYSWTPKPQINKNNEWNQNNNSKFETSLLSVICLWPSNRLRGWWSFPGRNSDFDTDNSSFQI